MDKHNGKTMEVNEGRRSALKTLGALGAFAVCAGAVPGVAFANNGTGSASGLREVKIGFVALTDAASVIMASLLGLDEKRGVKIKLMKFGSWASLRDALAEGKIDCAHCLYGLAVGMAGGYDPERNASVKVLMTLSQNGQAVTLSNILKRDSFEKSIKEAAGKGKPHLFANTYPTGTHAMLLNYWLAAKGVNPLKEIEKATVAPANMVANMMGGSLMGFCAGEPWNARAISEGVGYTASASQEIWQGHPEKVLACLDSFAADKNAAVGLICSILDASRWLDASDSNREKCAEALALRRYVNSPAGTILPRFLGDYDSGDGKHWTDKARVAFFDDGAVNYPYASDAIWFMIQHKRWGFAKQIGYEKLASEMLLVQLYEQAAAECQVSLPKEGYRKSKLMDGSVYDGKKPEAYAASFAIKA